MPWWITGTSAWIAGFTAWTFVGRRRQSVMRPERSFYGSTTGSVFAYVLVYAYTASPLFAERGR